jgi:hypothetical protein
VQNFKLNYTYFYDRNPDGCCVEDGQDRLPLHFACMYYEYEFEDTDLVDNYTQLMQFLLYKYPDSVSHKDKYLRLPIDYAIRCWNTHAMSFFVEVTIFFINTFHFNL